MRRFLPLPLVLLIALLGLLVLPAGAAAAPNVVIGIEQNGNMENQALRPMLLDTQAALGAKVIRYLVHYDRVAAACDPATAGDRTSPTNRCYDFSQIDGVVQGASDRGMQVILSIYGVPRWMFNAGENWTGGTDAEFATFTAAYADFTQATATRYDGRHGLPRVDQWTIWNEPNGSFFQPRMIAGDLVGPARYARLYDASARRIKAVDPAMRVAVGPTAPHAASLPPVKFAQEALPVLQQLGSPIDAWAHNAYMGAQSPFTSTIMAPYVGLGNLEDLTKLLDVYGVTRGKPVWVTEFGYQTDGLQKAVTLDEQALLLAEVLRFVWAEPRVETFIYYSLHDDEPTGDATSFLSGLYHRISQSCDGKLCAKPAASVFLHTLWISPASGGKVTLWGQGRMQPAATRIFVKRPKDGWRAYANPSTATSGTVTVRMALPVGTEVMTCDVRCGPKRTIAKSVTGGGGTPRIQRLATVRLAKASSLRSGIVFTVPCRGCKVSAVILARGPASGIAAARARTIIVGRSRVTGTATKRRVLVRFTAAAKRELAKRRSAKLTIRTYITSASGAKAITDRPIVLR